MDEYARASTTKEALNLLRHHGEKARIVGGGTLLYELESKGLLANVAVLVDISRLGLNYVKEDSSGLRIGASVTFSELLESDQINSRPAYGALVDALHAIRPVQVRNMATAGGALSSGVPVLDLPPTCLAMEAKVNLLGTKGRRTINIEDFFVGFLETSMKRGEFLIDMRIPRPPVQTGSAFQKLEINAVDWATLSVATKVSLHKGRVSGARIVFGAGVVGDVPKRATRSEEILEKADPTEDTIGRAVEEASSTTEFTDDERASSDYRREVSKVLLRDTLVTSVERAKSDSEVKR